MLGFNVDASFQLNTGALEPVRLPSHPPDSGATLTDIHVAADGTLQGRFSDGLSRDLGRIELSNFANPNGLIRLGDNQFAAGSNSGLPAPVNSQIVSGARELSNTSIGRELINLDRFFMMFRANLRVLETGDRMLQELMNLGRPK